VFAAWHLGQIFSAVLAGGCGGIDAVTTAGKGFPQVKQKCAVNLFGAWQWGHFRVVGGAGGIVSSAGSDRASAGATPGGSSD
jgi:hypothetical protein